MTFCMIYFFCAFIVIALASTLVPSGNWNGLNATRGLVRRKEKCWFQHQQTVVSRNGPSEKASNISVNIIWLSTNSSSSMWYLLWIAPAYLVLLSKLLIVCQGLRSQTSSYHEIASDERIRSSKGRSPILYDTMIHDLLFWEKTLRNDFFRAKQNAGN